MLGWTVVFAADGGCVGAVCVTYGSLFYGSWHQVTPSEKPGTRHIRSNSCLSTHQSKTSV